MLVKSELVAEISLFKLTITAPKALSFSKSTALIKETTSTNVSLSASAANKIASILAFSASMLDCNVDSAPSALDCSVDKSPSNLVTSAFVADTSPAKATSKESIDASNSV